MRPLTIASPPNRDADAGASGALRNGAQGDRNQDDDDDDDSPSSLAGDGSPMLASKKLFKRLQAVPSAAAAGATAAAGGSNSGSSSPTTAPAADQAHKAQKGLTIGGRHRHISRSAVLLTWAERLSERFDLASSRNQIMGSGLIALPFLFGLALRLAMDRPMLSAYGCRLSWQDFGPMFILCVIYMATIYYSSWRVRRFDDYFRFKQECGRMVAGVTVLFIVFCAGRFQSPATLRVYNFDYALVYLSAWTGIQTAWIPYLWSFSRRWAAEFARSSASVAPAGMLVPLYQGPGGSVVYGTPGGEHPSSPLVAGVPAHLLASTLLPTEGSDGSPVGSSVGSTPAAGSAQAADSSPAAHAIGAHTGGRRPSALGPSGGPSMRRGSALVPGQVTDAELAHVALNTLSIVIGYKAAIAPARLGDYPTMKASDLLSSSSDAQNLAWFIIHSPQGRRALRRQLSKEFALENYMFLLDCLELRKEVIRRRIKQAALMPASRATSPTASPVVAHPAAATSESDGPHNNLVPHPQAHPHSHAHSSAPRHGHGHGHGGSGAGSGAGGGGGGVAKVHAWAQAIYTTYVGDRAELLVNISAPCKAALDAIFAPPKRRGAPPSGPSSSFRLGLPLQSPSSPQQNPFAQRQPASPLPSPHPGNSPTPALPRRLSITLLGAAASANDRLELSPSKEQRTQQHAATTAPAPPTSILLPLLAYENIFAGAEMEIYDMLLRGPIARFVLAPGFRKWLKASLARSASTSSAPKPTVVKMAGGEA